MKSFELWGNDQINIDLKYYFKTFTVIKINKVFPISFFFNQPDKCKNQIFPTTDVECIH